jgi:ribonuclease BN (tRNA processing enzyme)
MHLTCIGTGTAAPEAEHVCSGYLLESHGLRLLFDCGGGVVHRMARLGIDWRDITHLVLTHFHNDHIGDVPLLFFAWKHGMRPGRSQPLTLIGPKGVRRLIQQMADVFGGHLSEPGFEIVMREMHDGEELRLDATTRLLAASTPHTEESLAYRVETDARSFCYTGDTGPSHDVAIFAQGVDLLLTECSVPDEEAMETHLTPSRVAEMARTALPRRLLLTHVYPHLDRDRLPDLVRASGWPATIDVAWDGATYEV